MQELIKINYDTEQPTVSARDLYEGLEIKERFSVWTERLKNYFGEDEFTSVGKPTEVLNNGGTQIKELQDYLVSVENAKHICLVSKSERGKQYRQYLIDLEKAWNTPEQVFARALKMAEQKIEELKNNNVNLIQDVNRMKPKEIFADAVSVSSTSILIGELAKILKQNGVKTGQNRLFEDLRNDGYLIKRDATDKNMPTQKSMELGLFEIKERTIVHSDGHITISKTPKVTGIGQQYFINKYLASKSSKQPV